MHDPGNTRCECLWSRPAELGVQKAATSPTPCVSSTHTPPSRFATTRRIARPRGERGVCRIRCRSASRCWRARSSSGLIRVCLAVRGTDAGGWDAVRTEEMASMRSSNAWSTWMSNLPRKLLRSCCTGHPDDACSWRWVEEISPLGVNPRTPMDARVSWFPCLPQRADEWGFLR